MDTQLVLLGPNFNSIHYGVRERSDRRINYFLAGYFLLGLVFASFYDTWLIAVGVGGLSLIQMEVYYKKSLELKMQDVHL